VKFLKVAHNMAINAGVSAKPENKRQTKSDLTVIYACLLFFD